MKRPERAAARTGLESDSLVGGIDSNNTPELPEHNGDRKRFLIWAAMAGFIPPERVVERIVADVEATL